MFYAVPPSQWFSMPNPPPPEDETTLPLDASVTTVFFVLALLTFISRIWIRWSGMLGLDDLFMTVAMVSTAAAYGLNLAIAIITGGKHTGYVSIDALLTTSKIAFAYGSVWLWSVTFIKISLCFMLLRIKSCSTTWSFWLWTLIGALLCSATAITITNFLMCRPLKANWELTMIITPDYCWSMEKFINFTYCYSAFFVLTDVICALLPAAFIMKMNRPLRDRIVLALLMGLGILASICGGMKMVDLRGSVQSNDPIWDAVPTQLWGLCEALIGIFAANIPTLRRPLEKALRAISGRTIQSFNSIPKRRSYSKPDGRQYSRQESESHDKEYSQRYNRNSRQDLESASQDIELPRYTQKSSHHSNLQSTLWNGSDVSEEHLTRYPIECYVTQEYQVTPDDGGKRY